jgi:deoxyribose-phosphate aldolase
MKSSELAGMIDHTILKPNATASQIDKLCMEAKEYGFASVCVNPVWVQRCKSTLSGSKVKVCTVIGFPLGANSTEAKAAEAGIALKHGADELDMVLNVGKLLDGELAYVERDIRAVVDEVRGKVVKVILEICFLDEKQIVQACKLAEKARAKFVKTSTGFGPSGATVEAVKLMRNSVSQRIGVKAAGGIKDYKTAMEMIKAGANRIGASAGVEIIKGGEK